MSLPLPAQFVCHGAREQVFAHGCLDSKMRSFFCQRSVGFPAHDHRGCSYSSALHHCYGEHPPPAGAGKVSTAIVSSRCCGLSFRVTILDASDIIPILIRQCLE